MARYYKLWIICMPTDIEEKVLFDINLQKRDHFQVPSKSVEYSI